jgi:hypothetical protein
MAEFLESRKRLVVDIGENEDRMLKQGGSDRGRL